LLLFVLTTVVSAQSDTLSSSDSVDINTTLTIETNTSTLTDENSKSNYLLTNFNNLSEQNITTITDLNTTQENNSSVNVYLTSSDTNLTKEESLLNDSISVQHDGITYNCSEADLISDDVNGTKVFHCATKEEKRIRDNSDARGTAEAEMLKQAIKDETEGESRVVLVENNESNLSERWKPFYYTKVIVDKVIPAKGYLSLRFAELYQNETFTFVDSGTRGGLLYYKEFENALELVFHYEASIQFSSRGEVIGSDAQVDDNSTGFILGTRLNYAALSRDNITGTVGKNWGVYYDIAGMTDKFMVFGALGNGVYNAGTDGGGSGTGRAANVLQLRIKKDVYNIGLQLQYHKKGFNLFYEGDYEYGAGVSLYYKGLDNGVKIGLTANYAHFETSKLLSDGHDIALLGGLSYQKNKVSLDYTIGASKNHITDDQGNYIEGIGSELYLRYRIEEKWRLALGFNYVFPDDQEYQGQYEVKDYIASMQYSLNENYTRLVYFEVKHSRGTNADGSEMGSAAALGFRYLLDY